MISFRRFIGSILISFVPSSLFRFKRLLLRFMAISYANNVKVNIGVKFYGSGEISIGNNTWIGPNCKFYTAGNSKITIGNNCDIAPEVAFICGSHVIGDSTRRAGNSKVFDILINNGTWIGARSTILGVEIGNSTVVGALTLVNKDLDSNSLYIGIPARKIKDLD
jgi:maltose O-acetyltransferase